MKEQNKKASKSSAKSKLKTCLYILLLLCFVFASVIAAQMIIGLIMVVIIGSDKFSQPVPTAIYSALSYAFALVLIVFIPKLIKRLKYPDEKKPERTLLGLKGLLTWTDLGLAPVGYVVYLLLAIGLTSLFSLFPWFNASEAQDVGFNTFIFGFDRMVAFITLVIIAPIAEEVIFRGWLYGKLRRSLLKEVARPWAIVISSLLVSVLFGLVHLQWNVWVNVFALSIVLCALREITGTIYSGIVLHMIKNGVAFVLLYIVGI